MIIAVSGVQIHYVDLFCGIGGFRLAMQNAAGQAGIRAECVFSSDIDAQCQATYAANFGEYPAGDITAIRRTDIPDHDILLAGFPCQPFSIIGRMKGFDDTRGTLFFDIASILKAKRPKAFVLENVKLLAGHNGGHTLSRIMQTVKKLGYQCEYKILNALDFGLPQKRERIFIVGIRHPAAFFEWPAVGQVPMAPLKSLLEKRVPQKFVASEHIRKSREKKVNGNKMPPPPNIWHENKGGNVSVHPFSCALRAGASYNYLLVNGKRRLTPREMLRLQGFADDFKIVSNDYQARKQAGNSLPVPVATQVIKSTLAAAGWSGHFYSPSKQPHTQTRLLERQHSYEQKTETSCGG